jgi:Transposase IS66 family
LVANCLAHGRRQFIEVAQSFPQECRYVLEALGRVYYRDAQSRQQSLSAPERLRFHQQHSTPVMEELHGWLQAQLAQKKTEPNSALGKAINYMLRHWRCLTVFLRQVAHLGAVKCAVKECILAVEHSPFQHLFADVVINRSAGQLFPLPDGAAAPRPASGGQSVAL